MKFFFSGGWWGGLHVFAPSHIWPDDSAVPRFQFGKYTPGNR